MTIETRIDPLEIDGKDIWMPERDKQLVIMKHWNVNRLVVLDFQGKKVTVSAYELTRAIQNATNF